MTLKESAGAERASGQEGGQAQAVLRRLAGLQPLAALPRRQVVEGALLAVLSVLGLLLLAWLFGEGAKRGDWGFDAYAYWAVSLEKPYPDALGGLGAFNYAPPLALLFQPAQLISFEAFRALWFALQVAALVWIGRRYSLALLLFVPASIELYNGNIHLVIAAAIVLGFRYPAVWAAILLTKVTLGVGLLWFVFRREWRNLAWALGATAAISLVTAVIVPGLWVQWLQYLASNPPTRPDDPVIQLTGFLPLRLLLATLIVAYGARTDRRWTVPVAATIALPTIWYNGLAILVAVLPLCKEYLAAAAAARRVLEAPSS
jgi:hypothetical protein